MSYKRTGVLSKGELESLGLLPPPERLTKGPVAIIECPEEIPCNICAQACPFGAIKKDTVYARPRLLADKCIGCGVCVAKCPGLAIFVVDLRERESRITLPYEMLPAPSKGDAVVLLDREGRPVGEGVVLKVWHYDGTYVVTVSAPRDKWLDVRAIRVRKK